MSCIWFFPIIHRLTRYLLRCIFCGFLLALGPLYALPINVSDLSKEQVQKIQHTAELTKIKSSIKNPTKIALVFDCTEYCEHWVDIMAQEISGKITYTMLEVEKTESKVSENKQQPAEVLADRLKKSKIVTNQSLLFYALQKNKLDPSYNVLGEEKAKKLKYQKFSRHVVGDDNFFKQVDSEILLPFQGKEWAIDLLAGLGMGNRGGEASTDVQSELPNSPHFEFLLEAKGVYPWTPEYFGYRFKFVQTLSYQNSIAEVSSSNSDKTMESTQVGLGLEVLAQWNENFFIGLGVKKSISNIVVANENFLGFGNKTDSMLVGLVAYYKWMQFSYYNLLSGKASDSSDYRGEPNLLSQSEINLMACPFSYKYFDFVFFPCVKAAYHTEKLSGPGTDSAPILNTESENTKKRTSLMFVIEARQNMQGGIF